MIFEQLMWAARGAKRATMYHRDESASGLVSGKMHLKVCS